MTVGDGVGISNVVSDTGVGAMVAVDVSGSAAVDRSEILTLKNLASMQLQQD